MAMLLKHRDLAIPMDLNSVNVNNACIHSHCHILQQSACTIALRHHSIGSCSYATKVSRQCLRFIALLRINSHTMQTYMYL